MSDLVEWMKRKFDNDPSKTRAGLAKVMCIDKSAVTRILAHERQIKAPEISAIAEYFGERPPIGFSEESAAFTGSEDDPTLAPVYEAISGSDGQWLLRRQARPIDYRPRAPYFENAARVFGFYAPDDAMTPRFKTGEIVWVDPARPVKPGDDILLISKADGAHEAIILGEFRKTHDNHYIFTQHRDQNERRFSAALWSALHVLSRY